MKILFLITNNKLILLYSKKIVEENVREILKIGVCVENILPV